MDEDWVFSAVQVAIQLTVFVVHLKYDKFYSSRTERLVTIITGCMVWVSALTAISQFTSAFSASVLGGILMCGFLLGLVLATTRGSRLRSLYLAARSSAKGLADDQVVSELLAGIEVYAVAAGGNHDVDYMVSSYLETHASDCTNPLCPVTLLKESDKLSLTKHRAAALESMLHSLNHKFKEVLLFHPAAVTLRLLYVGFLIRHVKNDILAWEVSEGTRGYKINVVHKFQLYCYKWVHGLLRTSRRKRLEETIVANKALDAMEPLRILLRNASAEKACRLVENNATVYGQLWDCLQECTPSYERFTALGFAFLETNRRIRRIWKRMTETRGSMLCRFVALYASYAEEILCNPSKADGIREYLDRPELLVQDSMLLQYVGAGNAVVGISAAVGSIGTIKSFNAAFCELTGYLKEELREAKLAKLIPKLYRDAHTKIFEKQCYLMESGHYADQMPEQAFVLHKSGHTVPVSVTIMAVPSYSSNYCFIARLRRVQSPTDHNTAFLLADSRNVLCGSTSSIYFVLP